MAQNFNKYRCSILGVERVPPLETNKYGIVHPLPFATRLSNIDGIVEKPAGKCASDLAVVGRYILTPRIFRLPGKTPQGAGNEIQLTDGIAALLNEERVLAYEFSGRRYDCGSKIGYLIATIEYGLQHAELGDEFMPTCNPCRSASAAASTGNAE